jgi:hypothetical protein
MRLCRAFLLASSLFVVTSIGASSTAPHDLETQWKTGQRLYENARTAAEKQAGLQSLEQVAKAGYVPAKNACMVVYEALYHEKNLPEYRAKVEDFAKQLTHDESSDVDVLCNVAYSWAHSLGNKQVAEEVLLKAAAKPNADRAKRKLFDLDREKYAQYARYDLSKLPPEELEKRALEEDAWDARKHYTKWLVRPGAELNDLYKFLGYTDKKILNPSPSLLEGVKKRIERRNLENSYNKGFVMYENSQSDAERLAALKLMEPYAVAGSPEAQDTCIKYYIKECMPSRPLEYRTNLQSLLKKLTESPACTGDALCSVASVYSGILDNKQAAEEVLGKAAEKPNSYRARKKLFDLNREKYAQYADSDLSKISLDELKKKTDEWENNAREEYAQGASTQARRWYSDWLTRPEAELKDLKQALLLADQGVFHYSNKTRAALEKRFHEADVDSYKEALKIYVGKYFEGRQAALQVMEAAAQEGSLRAQVNWLRFCEKEYESEKEYRHINSSNTRAKLENAITLLLENKKIDARDLSVIARIYSKILSNEQAAEAVLCKLAQDFNATGAKIQLFERDKKKYAQYKPDFLQAKFAKKLDELVAAKKSEFRKLTGPNARLQQLEEARTLADEGCRLVQPGEHNLGGATIMPVCDQTEYAQLLKRIEEKQKEGFAKRSLESIKTSLFNYFNQQ